MRRRAKPGAAYSRADRPGLRFFPGQLGGDQPGLFLVLQPVALALDVDRGRVVQQPVQDR